MRSIYIFFLMTFGIIKKKKKTIVPKSFNKFSELHGIFKRHVLFSHQYHQQCNAKTLVFQVFHPSLQRTDFHEFGPQLIYFWSLSTKERLTLCYKQ